jgi:hypothetical protein
MIGGTPVRSISFRWLVQEIQQDWQHRECNPDIVGYIAGVITAIAYKKLLVKSEDNKASL